MAGDADYRATSEWAKSARLLATGLEGLAVKRTWEDGGLILERGLNTLGDMKRFLLTSCLIVIAVSLAEAGSETYSSKETVPPPCPSWYADKEWNLNLWGTYAFPHNEYPAPGNTISMGRVFRLNGDPVGFDHDTYLGSDHAWGGGIDLKYFLCRYFGVGVQGFGLNATRSFGTVTVVPPPPGVINSGVALGTGHDERMVGGFLGTFTLRYPIACSRFAPYVWVGGGAIFGGGEIDEIIINDIPAGPIIERFHRDNETRAMGQFGGGFEIRLTPHIGWTNDFSWNVINGGNNNFGMGRTGINFAF
jgi:hypothetical protein